MTPTISVVIPTYNRSKLLRRAVRSILRGTSLAFQRESKLEVLISDDGSTDDSRSALTSEFGEEFDRGVVQWIDGPRRADPGAMRNRAAREAKGEILAFLDSDDEWIQGRLENFLPLMQNLDWLGESQAPDPYPGDPLLSLLERNRVATSSVLMRTSLFHSCGGFPEHYYGPNRKLGWEDYELWLKALLRLEKSPGLYRGARIVPLQFLKSEPQPHGAGDVGLKDQMKRELATLLRLGFSFPWRLRPLWVRRVLGAIKASV